MNIIPQPTASQLAWQAKELGFFCHFGINTFHNKEWSSGQLPPSSFDPKHLDPAQWVDTAQRSGARYLILTAKHHDGFCLWPTKTTEYSVKNSLFKGDVVAEVAKACAAAGMLFGLYLSPWDRNSPVYDDPEAYDRFYIAQMTELCSQYGELIEIWLDGAGSEGRVYNWDAIMDVVDRHQPNALVFNMGRPTIRWIGNEDGLASDPCYYAVDSVPISIYTDSQANLANASQKIYMPPECDVAIRQNWFWQDDDAHTIKSVEHLLGMYYRSVGNGSNLLLNLAPNRDGLLDELDREHVLAMRAELNKRFAHPQSATLYETADGYEADFGKEIDFDHLILREQLERGQRIDGYRILNADSGAEIISGVTVGFQKWQVFSKQRARRLKIEFAINTAPEATLAELKAYSTGHSTLPELSFRADPKMWERKSDPQHIPISPWRP